MIVLRRVIDFEYYGHLRIETLDLERREIAFRIEDQPVDARIQMVFDQKERFYPTVFIGPRFSQRGPTIVVVSHFEIDMHTARRSAATRVENVCGDCAHGS